MSVADPNQPRRLVDHRGRASHALGLLDHPQRMIHLRAGVALRDTRAQSVFRFQPQPHVLAAQRLETAPVSLAPGEELAVTLEWIRGNPVSKAYSLELALVDRAGTVQRQNYPLSSDSWEKWVPVQASYSLSIDPSLPSGQYQLQATLVPADWDGQELLTAHLLDIQLAAGQP